MGTTTTPRPRTTTTPLTRLYEAPPVEQEPVFVEIMKTGYSSVVKNQKPAETDAADADAADRVLVNRSTDQARKIELSDSPGTVLVMRKVRH